LQDIENNNFASLLLQQCRNRPGLAALIIPQLHKDGSLLSEETITFGDFEQRVCQFQRGLQAEGFRPGDRFVLMFPVSVDLYALIVALFAAAMVVVLVDPGMGKKQILRAISGTGAKALVTVRAVARLRWLLPSLWHIKMYVITSNRGSRLLGKLQRQSAELAAARPVIVLRGADDHALITFTSGTTGKPKGADRTHGFLRAQHESLAAMFPHVASDVDCTCFPAMVLHGLCCGITTVIPAVDLRAPASVNPAQVISQLKRHGVTRFSGAPAFMSALAEYINRQALHLPGVQQLAIGGAPVADAVCQNLVSAFPSARAYVVYGSTEAEPMTRVTLQEVLSDGDPSGGYLVGRTSDTTVIKIVRLPVPPPVLDERGIEPFTVASGETGEIVVCGPQVNRSYVSNPEENRKNKVIEIGGQVWHRTGDVGRLDARNRLCLLGRVNDVLDLSGSPVYPFPVERSVDALSGIRRSALVQAGPGKPAFLVLELEKNMTLQALESGVKSCLAHHRLAGVQIQLMVKLPVDRRHNSKIDRIALRKSLA